MKKTFLSFLLVLIFIQCSCSNKEEDNINQQEDYVRNDAYDLRIINEIIHDTGDQMRYVNDRFYTVDEDFMNRLELPKEEFDLIINYN